MAGHIRRRGKGSWAVVVDLGYDPGTGKRRRLWRSIKGPKRDAEALLVQLLHQRDTGIDAPPGKLTLGDYLPQWLEDCVKPAAAPKTYRAYADVVHKRLVPALGGLPLTRLRPPHIQAFYSQAIQEGRHDGEGGLAPRTVLRYHHVLHAALRQAVQWQLLARNPADAVQPPKAERSEMRVLLPEEVRGLVDAADRTPYGTLVHTAVSTGMRVGELLGMRWRDLDLDIGVAHVQQTCQWIPGQGFIFRQPKTAAGRRQVALSPESIQRLRQHRQQQLEQRLVLGPIYRDKDLVFATTIGTPISPANLRRTWLRILEDAGVGRLRFHDLRHCHASLLLAQGVHPKIVSERLGHSGVGITLNTYSHVLPGLQAQAAAEFDGLLARS